jgi:hypothetical protein
MVLPPGAEPAPPTWGGQIEKKSFGGAKIRKNNKIWGKILIFFLFFLGRTSLVAPPLAATSYPIKR